MKTTIKVLVVLIFFAMFCAPAMFAASEVRTETRHCVSASSQGPNQALLNDGLSMALLTFLQHEDGSPIQREEYKNLPDTCYYLPAEAKPDEAKFAEVMRAVNQVSSPVNATAEPVGAKTQVLPENAAALASAQAEISRLEALLATAVSEKADLQSYAARLQKADQGVNSTIKGLVEELNQESQSQRWRVSAWWPIGLLVAFALLVVLREKHFALIRSQLAEDRQSLEQVNNDFRQSEKGRDGLNTQLIAERKKWTDKAALAHQLALLEQQQPNSQDGIHVVPPMASTA